MAEYDVLSGPPVLAIDLYAVVHRDRGHSVGLLCAGQESWMGSPTWLLQRTSPVKACSGDQTPNVAARRGSVTKRSRCFHPRDSLSRRHGWTASRDRTPDIRVRRSEERRVGKECVSTCRFRWSPDHLNKKKTETR